MRRPGYVAVAFRNHGTMHFLNEFNRFSSRRLIAARPYGGYRRRTHDPNAVDKFLSYLRWGRGRDGETFRFGSENVPSRLSSLS